MAMIVFADWFAGWIEHGGIRRVAQPRAGEDDKGGLAGHPAASPRQAAEFAGRSPAVTHNIKQNQWLAYGGLGTDFAFTIENNAMTDPIASRPPANLPIVHEWDQFVPDYDGAPDTEDISFADMWGNSEKGMTFADVLDIINPLFLIASVKPSALDSTSPDAKFPDVANAQNDISNSAVSLYVFILFSCI